ncbi:MAG: DUF4249 family protein [Ignavibacteriales bacterium]|nr:DUF4249 family protein [Ignavibacteriales bacterium]
MKILKSINIEWKILVMILTTFFFSACGEGTVDLTQSKYEPKIVVEGYLYPGHQIGDIRISRNMPLNKQVDFETIVLKDAIVKISDLSDGHEYILKYEPSYFTFFVPVYTPVEYGKSYKLEVWATIDGKNLYASSTTKVPEKGLKIVDNPESSLSYREKDTEGNLKKYNISFTLSYGAEFYALSVCANLSILSLNNFIYENPYFKPDTNDIKDNFSRYTNSSYTLQNFNPYAEKLNIDIEWTSIWFYGKYRAIVYAGDKNFKDFFLTQDNVQEMDGNFHEPKLHIDGDGIGVFGSAVADTVYFTITK